MCLTFSIKYEFSVFHEVMPCVLRDNLGYNL